MRLASDNNIPYKLGCFGCIEAAMKRVDAHETNKKHLFASMNQSPDVPMEERRSDTFEKVTKSDLAKANICMAV